MRNVPVKIHPFGFWTRPLTETDTRGVFGEGLIMAFALSLYWLAGTLSYYSLIEHADLVPLTIVFFGTTFFAVPSCILGGFTALILFSLFRAIRSHLTEARAIFSGVVLGTILVMVFTFSRTLNIHLPVPYVAACTLYIAMCGRLSAKIYGILSH